MQLIYDYLVQVLWISWGVYWKIAAGNVKPTTRRDSGAARIVYTVPLVLGASVLLLHGDGDNPLFREIWRRTILGYWVGIGVMLLGFAFTIWARLTLGRNWSGTVTMKESHELIQTGPYAWVRHPIYTGLILMFIGTAIVVDQWRGWLAPCLVTLGFYLKLRIEERWMRELFGAAYDVYAKRVGMLVPGVG